MRLSGKTALITGGATGIGKAIAHSFANEGCRVAIAGRREEKLREAAAEWKGAPPIELHTVDVADRGSVNKLVQWAGKSLGKIDILVNSAGINTPRRMMADMPPETWDEVMKINATGPYNCIHAVLPEMRERKDGLIINIDSISGLRATKLGGLAYSASKFALTALGTIVALEEGGNGIRVTNICPGEVDTPLLDGRPAPVTAEHRGRDPTVRGHRRRGADGGLPAAPGARARALDQADLARILLTNLPARLSWQIRPLSACAKHAGGRLAETYQPAGDPFARGGRTYTADHRGVLAGHQRPIPRERVAVGLQRTALRRISKMGH